MIEKKRPRVLNSSKDSRVRGPEEMSDALNINASSDYGEDDAGGNVGTGRTDGRPHLSSRFIYLWTAT